MLTLEYGRDGYYCSDFDTEQMFEQILNRYKKEPEMYIKISSELLLLRIRVGIKHGQIDHKDVCLKFHDNSLSYFDKDANLDKYPNSFSEIYLNDLIGW